jgi:ribosomal protein S2
MNDDASKALEYILDLVGEAIEEGKTKIKKVKTDK